MPWPARSHLEQHVILSQDSSGPAQTSPTRVLTKLAWPLAGIAGSALLLGLYARGGSAWPLGFIALVPWMLTLNRVQTLGGALASGLLMSVAFALAVFAWFGAAFGAYVGLGTVPAILILAVLAPLLQPQVLAFALARHWAARRNGLAAGALAGAAAWVGCEWLVPKLLGDTLGHGLLPSPVLRQMADLGGAAGLSVVLLWVNEALASAIARWRLGTRAVLRPAATALVLVVAATGYGTWRLSALQSMQAEPAQSIRIGLIQSNITHYERLREEMGAYAVIRHVLDTHYAMSEYAVREQGAEALLWSETVFPTTFGSPKSADGAELDQEILAFVERIGVPLVFGTYDQDVGGEYNSAAFVEPGRGLLGHYRKAHPFPLTEHVPDWLDGPWLRRWLPWAGNWQAGAGARVLPLRTADGREVDVLPLICLDDVRSALSIEGSRLGAQAILGLSNDAWFTDYPQGARLHLTVAAFRSIETRLPQLRVTTNGLSALIDESGEVMARTDMGQQAVLVGEIPVRPAIETLMVRWGDWVGPAGLCLLLLLALVEAWRLALRRAVQADANPPSDAAFTARVALLTPPWRAVAGLLRLTAGLGLAWLLTGMLVRTGLQVNSLAQLWLFAGGVLAPALAAWAIQRSFAAQARISAGLLVFEQPAQRIEIPVHEIRSLRAWRIALPHSGVDLVLASGRRWRQGVVLADPQRLRQALNQAGSPATWTDRLAERIAEHASIRATAHRRWLDHAVIKFALFPLMPALVAFRLHQHIAFGGTFGEYYTYGLGAWLSGLAIWWGAWAIGLMLLAAGLRIMIEAGSVGLQLAGRTRARAGRHALEWLARVIFYVGVPVWLVLRIVSG
jgi:apolipoprotein N-acyltransferase